MELSKLSELVGCSYQHLHAVQSRKKGLSKELAESLEKATGIVAAAWMWPERHPVNPWTGKPNVEGEVPPKEETPDQPTLEGECLDDYPAVIAFHQALRDGKSIEEAERLLDVAIGELKQTLTRWRGEKENV